MATKPKAKELDKSKPYSKLRNDPGARFWQDGKRFDAQGKPCKDKD